MTIWQHRVKSVYSVFNLHFQDLFVPSVGDGAKTFGLGNIFKSANPGLIFLCIFVLFTFQFKWQIFNLNYINWKSVVFDACDSNPGPQDGRSRWIRWAMVAPLPYNIKYSTPLLPYGMSGSRKTSWDGSANKKHLVSPLNLKYTLVVYLIKTLGMVIKYNSRFLTTR